MNPDRREPTFFLQCRPQFFPRHWLPVLAILQLPAYCAAACFATNIRPTVATITAGTSTSITYLLNEAADSVQIKFADGSTTAAAFAGTTLQGQNSVAWNGRQDNASGPPCPAGSWSIYVTATKAHSKWEDIASHRSLAAKGPSALHSQAFANSPSNDCIPLTYQDGANYGVIVANISASAGPGGGISFWPDLSLRTKPGALAYHGDLFSTGEGGIEGLAEDPLDTRSIYFTGVTGAYGCFVQYLLGFANARYRSAAPNLENVRSIVVRNEAPWKYAYTAGAVSTIRKTRFTAPDMPMLTTSSVLIQTDLSTSFLKGLAFDSRGNLYAVSRYSDAAKGTGGALYRWDRNQVEVDPTLPIEPLTTASATWSISMPANLVNISGPAITPGGDVYIASISGADMTKAPGIYYVGNSATPSLVRTIGMTDQVVDFKHVGTPPVPWEGSPRYFNLTTDAVGNLLAVDRATEQIRLFAPPGTSTHTTCGPAYSKINVTAAVGEWAQY